MSERFIVREIEGWVIGKTFGNQGGEKYATVRRRADELAARLNREEAEATKGSGG